MAMPQLPTVNEKVDRVGSPPLRLANTFTCQKLYHAGAQKARVAAARGTILRPETKAEYAVTSGCADERIVRMQTSPLS